MSGDEAVRWRIRMWNGVEEWTIYFRGSYRDALRHAEQLCYEPTTRFSMARADA